jgi:hypothetical protein
MGMKPFRCDGVRKSLAQTARYGLVTSGNSRREDH